MQKRNAYFNFGFVCLALVSALLLSAGQAESKPTTSDKPPAKAKTKRRSVIDYYYLLPWVGNGGIDTRQQRRELLQPVNKPIIDVPHDYLLVNPDASPAQQIAVFRARGKTDLIAVSTPDFKSDYNWFVLYQLRDGKLQDVTSKMLPVPVRPNKFLYEVPRIGTTIRVYSFDLDKQSRRHAFDLKWRKGRFIKDG